jgi:hypothetical protein
LPYTPKLSTAAPTGSPSSPTSHLLPLLPLLPLVQLPLAVPLMQMIWAFPLLAKIKIHIKHKSVFSMVSKRGLILSVLEEIPYLLVLSMENQLPISDSSNRIYRSKMLFVYNALNSKVVEAR